MMTTTWWTRIALVGGLFAWSSCGLNEDLDDSATEQDVSAGACTAVKMTSPSTNFTGTAGVPMTLSALATCPAGSTPEYQFWGKIVGAANWTILGAYVPGSFSWTPPTAGNWNISAVTRNMGAPENYQARSLAIIGTIAPFVNHPPVANPDSISTLENVAGSVDVLANDTDADGDAMSVTAHTNGAHGTVSVTGSTATYTPAAGFVGTDSFTYDVSDTHGGTTTGTVNVDVVDQAPVANDDSLTTTANTPGTVNVLTNDTDPDGDTLSVTSFTQGAHGTVSFAGGVATFTPAASYIGADSFTYTVDDGHGMTDVGTVNVMVNSGLPGCTISLSAPATGTWGSPIHLVATAACNTGAPDVQFYHRVNNTYVTIKAYSSAQTFDFTADTTGDNSFYAQARTHGTTTPVASSNTVHVNVADNVPQCTSVKMTAPVNGATLTVNMPATLTAVATCPAGVTAEYQYWVKPTTTANWTMLPGFTTGSGSFTPNTTGTWNVTAVARAVGAHVTYQVRAMSQTVTVAP